MPARAAYLSALSTNETSGHVVDRAPKKETDWQPPFALALELRNQIRCAHVESDSGCEWQTVLAEQRDLQRKERAEEARDG